MELTASCAGICGKNISDSQKATGGHPDGQDWRNNIHEKRKGHHQKEYSVAKEQL